jgi:hypothetical protein
MSKKRPGVEAGVNLVALNDVKVWERIESHCADVTAQIPRLTEHEAAVRELMGGGEVAAPDGSSNPPKEHFTKSELDKVVLWKHTVGKNRIYNIKYLNANTEDAIEAHSRAAIALARTISAPECLEEDGTLSATGRASMQEAIGELGKLKGVGPATASAILSLVRPDVFCFLYDECIDTFEKTRDYKVSNYLRVNSRCLQLARDLGADWTTARVAKTIWTAARFLALNGRDLTAELHLQNQDDDDTDSGDSAAREEGENAGASRKLKKQRAK